ncbi:MAG: transposase [bacterium]|nr:transposase [bacterium]
MVTDAFLKRRKYSRKFIEEAIKRYIEDNTSFRNIARRMEVGSATVLSWVNEVGKRCKDSLRVAAPLKPCWSGIFGIDGKPVTINGREKTVLVGVDMDTKDLVHIDLVNAEAEPELERFLVTIREVLQEPFSLSISDLGKGKVMVQLIKRLFPQIPHQACVVHFMRYIHRKLPKSKKSKYYKQNHRLREQIRKILFATTLHEANQRFAELLSRQDQFSRTEQKSMLKSLRKHYGLLTAHFDYQQMPRDNNIVENVIKQLNKKLQQIESFKKNENAYNFLKLWAIFYRFKPFTDSKYTNGLSPLEIAKIDLKGIDWLKFSQYIDPVN